MRALPTYRGDANARTWLLAITRHTCLDELRARYRQHGHHEPLTDGSEPISTGNRPDQDLLVQDLLVRLQPDRRTAFVLTQIIGLSYQEAARVCDCPTGTIRSRVARARADLLRVLDDVEQPHRPATQAETDTA